LAVAQHLPRGRHQAGDRHLKFHDDRDNLIRGGYKVYSVELEYLLVSHPRIEVRRSSAYPTRSPTRRSPATSRPQQAKQ